MEVVGQVGGQGGAGRGLHFRCLWCVCHISEGKLVYVQHIELLILGAGGK